MSVDFAPASSREGFLRTRPIVRRHAGMQPVGRGFLETLVPRSQPPPMQRVWDAIDNALIQLHSSSHAEDANLEQRPASQRRKNAGSGGSVQHRALARRR